MALRPRTISLAAAIALGLPAAIGALLAGSCSLSYLYDGATGGAGGASSSSSSASSGASSSGSTDGSADADGGMDTGTVDAPAVCPSDMVAIGTSADAGYCVDRLEVTNVEYGKFLAVADASAPQEPPGRCDWNSSYAPATPVDAGDDLPVLGVDWCDAYAYCRWAGKRLCGAVGSGPIAPAVRDSIDGQWFRACTHGDTRVYPYSTGTNQNYMAGTCADCEPTAGCPLDASAPTTSPAPVGTKKGCVGGYGGLYDMSGNAAEWEDGCDDAGLRPDATDDAGHMIPDPRYDTCYHRGGSFWDHPVAPGPACLSCSTAQCNGAADIRSRRPRDVGLRCCLDY